MAQTLVRPGALTGDRFSLDGSEAHHLVRVLRAAVGDEIVLFDGDKRRCRGVIEFIDPAIPAAKGRITAEIPVNSDRCQLRLFQGLPKGSKIDFVIEKAVELGAASIFPYTSERGQVKVDTDAADSKFSRWNRVAEAAAKQCDRPDVPAVSSPSSLVDLQAELKNGTTLVLSLSAGAPSLKDILRPDEASILKPDSDIINIVVGPESGLSPGEESTLVSWGGRLVSIGSRVLRTETAGLAALAILQYEMNQG